MERYFILIMIVISVAAIATGKDRSHCGNTLKPYTKINTSVGAARDQRTLYNWLPPVPVAESYFMQ